MRERRLFGQSCRLQTFGTIEVHPGAPDPVAAKIEDRRKRLIDRDAAALPASLEPSKHKRPVAEILREYPAASVVGVPIMVEGIRTVLSQETGFTTSYPPGRKTV